MNGQELYEAYREVRLRKAGQMFMPAWDGLPGEERDAWLGLEAVVAARVSPQRAQRATEEQIMEAMKPVGTGPDLTLDIASTPPDEPPLQAEN